MKKLSCCVKGGETKSGSSSPAHASNHGASLPSHYSNAASPAGIMSPRRLPAKSPTRKLYGPAPKVLGGSSSFKYPTTKQRTPGRRKSSVH
ncbi:hypothetical protein ONE63_011316 [Megalurothrips usitatus]|uniref:Uncharacterized protein n=1 Tax=Megalurothrips usitatus TaxID=439358 RepID=A0AAV7X4Y0_9NEOP|nr:hypothetical protein ONE63_011316 [Megalurothrips usitatus]